jgi:hypothetical protein
MITGVLIAESLRVGATLEGVPLTARKLWRIAIEDPMVEQPSAWTLIQFEAAEADGPRLAAALAAVLDDAPGWYADFHSPTEKFVVFPGRVFRYPRGDRAARAEAEEHARSLGIPDAQLDWPD